MVTPPQVREWLVLFAASLIIGTPGAQVVAEPKTANIRWESSFTESYLCRATGRKISFAVRTPPEVERIEKYPMIVVLKGGPRAAPSEALPYFQIKPAGGGIWGYRTMSAVDAMQAIAFMKEHYPIDSDRISLVGFSAGGSGAMHLASLHPDEFSAVVAMVAAGNDYPVEAFKNLPVAFHHGDRDWTSAICDARVQFQKMTAAECPVILKEYPGAGHSIPGSHEPIVQWMLDQRRHPARTEPKAVDFLEGAAWNLYRGEPMLVVVGTGGNDPSRTRQLQAAAEKLARCGGPQFGFMNHTRFPVVTDSALSPAQEAEADLLLVGTPDENAVAARLLKNGPIRFENGTLQAGKRAPLPLDGQVVSLAMAHPDHASRFVYLVAPFVENAAGFAAKPQKFLVGSNGFHPAGQPELRIQDLQNRIAREMQRGQDGDWIFHGGESMKIPAGFEDRDRLARTYLEVMREQSGADFGIWWGPADQGMWGTDFNYLPAYQPEFYTADDFRAHVRPVETMTGGVSGADLKTIHQRWIAKREITVVPELKLDSLDDEASYRIHIPMDLYIKLGQRQKNLIDPKPGPVISNGQIFDAIFE